MVIQNSLAETIKMQIVFDKCIFFGVYIPVSVNLKKKKRDGERKSIEIKRKYSAKWIIKVHRLSFVSAIC